MFVYKWLYPPVVGPPLDPLDLPPVSDPDLKQGTAGPGWDCRSRAIHQQACAPPPSANYSCQSGHCVQQQTLDLHDVSATLSAACKIVLSGFQVPFPPAVAHRLFLSALTAAIESPGVDLWH